MVTIASNYGESELHLEKVSNMKLFIYKFNWDRIKYPSQIDIWETLKKNNPTIAFNVLYTKELKACPVYISKIVFETFVKNK